MPFRDGTGPSGMGPGSRRGRGGFGFGFCSGSISRSVFRGRQGWLLGIAAPLVTAVLRDVLNPSGVLRRIVHVTLNKWVTGICQKTRRKAEYTVMNENSVIAAPKQTIPERNESKP